MNGISCAVFWFGMDAERLRTTDGYLRGSRRANYQSRAASGLLPPQHLHIPVQRRSRTSSALWTAIRLRKTSNSEVPRKQQDTARAEFSYPVSER